MLLTRSWASSWLKLLCVATTVLIQSEPALAPHNPDGATAGLSVKEGRWKKQVSPAWISS